jgi:hypothetical protein
MIEIYNPNRWMTFGGMGSKKLIGENIEYIENDDSHVGAQFSSQFRDLVKTEVAKMSTAGDVETAQAETPQAPAPTRPGPVTADLSKPRSTDSSDPIDILSYAEPRAEIPKSANKSAKLPNASKADAAAAAPAKSPPKNMTTLLDSLSSAADSGNLSVEPRQLTTADMADYAKRTYQTSQRAAVAGDNSF